LLYFVIWHVLTVEMHFKIFPKRPFYFLVHFHKVVCFFFLPKYLIIWIWIHWIWSRMGQIFFVFFCGSSILPQPPPLPLPSWVCHSVTGFHFCIIVCSQLKTGLPWLRFIKGLEFQNSPLFFNLLFLKSLPPTLWLLFQLLCWNQDIWVFLLTL
jgi:hypothetical protein